MVPKFSIKFSGSIYDIFHQIDFDSAKSTRFLSPNMLGDCKDFSFRITLFAVTG